MKRSFVKGVIALLAIAVVSVSHAKADVLWNAEASNGLGGVLVTHAGGMSTGEDRSAIGAGGNGLGGGMQQTAGNRVADQFTVGGPGWQIASLTFFAYQTSATVPTTPSLTGVTVQIWSGDPGTGTLVWGDTTTNLLTSAAVTNTYRTSNTVNNNFDRRIQTGTASGLNVFLAPGTYFLDWSMSGTIASGPWQPYLAAPGATSVTVGTAQQLTATTGAFNPLLDTAAAVQVSLPFVIEGTAIPEPGTFSILALGAIAGLVRRRK